MLSLLLSGNASHFLSVSTCAALWWRVRLLFVSVSPESSVPSIISEWLRFVSRVSSPPAFAWLQICWGGGFGDVISVPSPRCHSQPPLGFFSPDVAGCLLHQREETLLPLLMLCPLGVVVGGGGYFFICLSPRFIWYGRKTHSGCLSLARSDYSLCGSVREIIIRRWMQTCSHLELHPSTCFGVWEAVRTCHWSISNRSIFHQLRSLVGVWKLLFEWFSFSFFFSFFFFRLVANYSPITVIYIHLSCKICLSRAMCVPPHVSVRMKPHVAVMAPMRCF